MATYREREGLGKWAAAARRTG